MIDGALHMFRATGAALWEAMALNHEITDTCSRTVLTRLDDSRPGIIPGSPDRRIAGSPDRRIAGSPDRRIAGSRVREGHGRVRMAVPPASLSAFRFC